MAFTVIGVSVRETHRVFVSESFPVGFILVPSGRGYVDDSTVFHPFVGFYKLFAAHETSVKISVYDFTEFFRSDIGYAFGKLTNGTVVY